eukprot:493167-Prymnesium_polylepis.1
MMNYLGAVSTFQGKLIMLDEVEIGGQNHTPSYVNSASVTETDDEGKPCVVKTGIIPQYYNRSYNGQIFRQKLVADFEVQIDYGVNKLGDMYVGVETLKAYYIQIEFSAYIPLAGAAYVELPAALQAKKCMINVQNKDNRCFEYSLLAALHQDEIKQDCQRPTKYEQWLGTINLGGAPLPIKVNAQVYKKIEKLNQLSICVYGFSDEEIAVTAENCRK